MTTFDPFTEAESVSEPSEALPEANPPEVVSVAPQEISEPLVSVTLKGGTGYDSPWTVLKFPDIQSADQALENSKEAIKRILDNSAQMGGYYSKLSNKSNGNGSQQAATQEAPGGEERFCAHGKMTFRSGVSKSSGKPYQAFFCSAQDRNQQCKPQFLN